MGVSIATLHKATSDESLSMMFVAKSLINRYCPIDASKAEIFG
jgi:hypothetical protein